MKPLVFVIFGVFSCLILSAQPPVGSQTPDINLPGIDGTNISLSSLKGQVVVLDFWASWCGPCRRNNLEMVNIYNKFHKKGLQVYAVSIDENKDQWQQAIKKDKMPWLHVIDVKATYGNQLTNTWNLRYIPSTFVIDKQGKIVAIGAEKEELEKLIEGLL